MQAIMNMEIINLADFSLTDLIYSPPILKLKWIATKTILLNVDDIIGLLCFMVSLSTMMVRHFHKLQKMLQNGLPQKQSCKKSMTEKLLCGCYARESWWNWIFSYLDENSNLPERWLVKNGVKIMLGSMQFRFVTGSWFQNWLWIGYNFGQCIRHCIHHPPSVNLSLACHIKWWRHRLQFDDFFV